MKSLTCTSCGINFKSRYTDLPKQTGRCKACQFNHEISEAQHNIAAINDKKTNIYPSIAELLKEKERLETAYNNAKDAWSQVARLYEKLDRKQAMIQHDLDLKLNQHKKITRNKKSPGQAKSTKTPEQLAHEAIMNLPESVRDAVLAQYQQNQ